MSEVLRLASVSKSFEMGKATKVRVLDGVELAVCSGETVGLVAPSGAGKSTLLHIAGLLDSPDSGEVVINGRNLERARDGRRTRVRRLEVGFVYQLHHLLREFSALENVMLPQLAAGIARKRAKERAAELLEETGMGDRLSHRPAELSGGEQQRVAICRALANGPRLLLADEPTGNLDPDTSGSVFDVLLKLVRDEHLAVLIATHDHDLAGRLDRTVRLESGRLVSS